MLRSLAVSVVPGIAMTYRPGDVAKQLEIAVVTLRVWSNEFAGFLSEGAQRSVSSDGKPAQRRYSDSDIDLLKRAKALLDLGSTFDEARRALVEAEPIPPQMVATLEEATRFLAEVKNSYDQLLEARNMTLAEQRDHIQTLQNMVEQQRAEIEALRAAAARPWWRRIFGG